MLCPPGTNAPASGRDSGAGDVLSRQLAAFAPRERGAGLVPASAGHTLQFSSGEIRSKCGWAVRGRIRRAEVAMKPAILIGALLVSLTICGKAVAQPTTGQQIQSKCKELVNEKMSQVFDAGFCGGFIDGVIDSQTMEEANDKTQNRRQTPRFCLPQEGTNGQYVQVFFKYLGDHPEELHRPAAFLLVESLVKAFPCGK
jgi:hypothetical protein